MRLVEQGKPLAVKIVAWRTLPAAHRASVRNEVRALRRLPRHPHIVSLEGVFFSSSRAFILMPLLRHGSLFKRLRGLRGGARCSAIAQPLLLQASRRAACERTRCVGLAVRAVRLPVAYRACTPGGVGQAAI